MPEEAKTSEVLAEEGGSGQTKTIKEDKESDEDFDPEHPESSEQDEAEVEEEVWDDEENVQVIRRKLKRNLIGEDDDDSNGSQENSQ